MAPVAGPLNHQECASYTNVLKFVVTHLQLAKEENYKTSALTKACCEHFDVLPNENELRRNEGTQAMLGHLRKMTKEGILDLRKTTNGTVCQLDPTYSDMTLDQLVSMALPREVSETPNNPGQKGVSVEAVPLVDLAGNEDADGDDSGLGLSDQDGEGGETARQEGETRTGVDVEDKGEGTRHSDAYAAMTRLANPMAVPSASAPAKSQEIRTPRRKRRRIMEIAPSDGSSNFDPISPVRSNSTPRRHSRAFNGMRSATPLSETRRRSAPTRVLLPLTDDALGDAFQMDVGHTMFKEERRNTSPAWLVEAVANLKAKFPNERLYAENGRVKCWACDRLFQAHPGAGLGGIHTHLRSNPHRAQVAKRKKEEKAKKDFYIPTGSGFDKSIDLSAPQPPLMVFTNKGQQTTQQLRQQYLQSMANDEAAMNIRVSLAESRVNAAAEKTKEQLEAMDKKIETGENKRKRDIDQVSDVLTSAVERCKERVKDLSERLDVSRFAPAEQLNKLEHGLADLEEKHEAKHSDMIARLTRSDHRNIDQIGNLSERLNTSSKASETQLNHLADKIGTQNDRLADQIKDLGNSTKDSLKAQNTKLNHLSSRMDEFGKVEEVVEALKDSTDEFLRSSNDRLNQFEDKADYHIDEVRLMLRHQEAQMAEALQEQIEMLASLKKIIAIQHEEIKDLQTHCQSQTREMRLQKEADNAFRTRVQDQMNIHIDQTEVRVKKLEEVNKYRLDNMQQQMEERMAVQLNALEEQAAKRLRGLERFKREQTEDTNTMLEKVVPALIQDMDELRTYTGGIEKTLAEKLICLNDASTKKKPLGHTSPRKIDLDTNRTYI